MFSTQITVSLFVHIFDIISLFAAELEKPKIGISLKGRYPEIQCKSSKLNKPADENLMEDNCPNKIS